MSEGEDHAPPLLEYAAPQPRESAECDWGEGKRWLFLAGCLFVFVPVALGGCAAVFNLVIR